MELLFVDALEEARKAAKKSEPKKKPVKKKKVSAKKDEEPVEDVPDGDIYDPEAQVEPQAAAETQPEEPQDPSSRNSIELLEPVMLAYKAREGTLTNDKAKQDIVMSFLNSIPIDQRRKYIITLGHRLLPKKEEANLLIAPHPVVESDVEKTAQALSKSSLLYSIIADPRNGGWPGVKDYLDRTKNAISYAQKIHKNQLEFLPPRWQDDWDKVERITDQLHELGEDGVRKLNTLLSKSKNKGSWEPIPSSEEWDDIADEIAITYPDYDDLVKSISKVSLGDEQNKKRAEKEKRIGNLALLVGDASVQIGRVWQFVADCLFKQPILVHNKKDGSKVEYEYGRLASNLFFNRAQKFIDMSNTMKSFGSNQEGYTFEKVVVDLHSFLDSIISDIKRLQAADELKLPLEDRVKKSSLLRLLFVEQWFGNYVKYIDEGRISNLKNGNETFGSLVDDIVKKLEGHKKKLETLREEAKQYDQDNIKVRSYIFEDSYFISNKLNNLSEFISIVNE